MPLKIAFVGGGSLGFTRRLIQDLLCVPEFQDSHFFLMDINRRNLEMTAALIRRDIEFNRFSARVSTSVDRKAALSGADYVFCVIRQQKIDFDLRSGKTSRFQSFGMIDFDGFVGLKNLPSLV